MPCSRGICSLHHFDGFPLTIAAGASACGHGYRVSGLSSQSGGTVGPENPAGDLSRWQKLCTGLYTALGCTLARAQMQNYKCIFCLVFFSSLEVSHKRIRVKRGGKWVFFPLIDCFYL